MSSSKQPVVFVDRDDTLIDDPGYLRNPDQLRILPGVPQALRRLRDAGFAVVIVTNQSGIARGFLTEDELKIVHERLQEMLAASGSAVDAIYYCPYLAGRDAKVDAYRMDSELRKPKPGMLLKAAAEMNLDLERSWMVGDRARDVEAGRGAGCRTILIGSGAKGEAVRPDHMMPDFPRAADLILRESSRLAEMRAIVSRARRREAELREKSAGSETSVAVTSPPEPPPPRPAPVNPPEPEQEIRKPTAGEPSEQEMKPTSQTRPDADRRVEPDRPQSSDPKATPQGERSYSTGSRDDRDPFDILCELLDEVKLMRRERQFEDFSFAQLVAAIAQAIALCAVGFGLYSFLDKDLNTAMVALLAGIAFQLMALTGFMIKRRR